MNLDKYGLIVQSTGDGGDSAQRMGMYWFGIMANAWLRNTPVVAGKEATPFLLPGILNPSQTSGGWIRTPTLWNDPTDFSRDQQFPLSLVLEDQYVWSMVWNHVKRIGRYQNADILSPQSIASYIRSLGLGRWLYPVLCILDIGAAIGSLTDIYAKTVDPTDTDDNNAIILHILNYGHQPTPMSWAARKIYAKWRPMNAGNVAPYNEPTAIMGALVDYHSAASGGSPEMAELYRPLVSMVFYGSSK